MQPFRNILVGVDLAQYDASTLQPSAVAGEVAHRALWLAEKMSARLTFFSTLDLAPETLPHLDETDYRFLATTAEQNAGKILHGLVHQRKPATSRRRTSWCWAAAGWSWCVRCCATSTTCS